MTGQGTGMEVKRGNYVVIRLNQFVVYIYFEDSLLMFKGWPKMISPKSEAFFPNLTQRNAFICHEQAGQSPVYGPSD